MLAHVVDTVAAGGILLHPRAGEFERVVERLVGSLVERGRLPEALQAEAVRAVCERERAASTALVEIGVSVPHARLDGLEGMAAALAVSSDVLYEAMVGVPISICALVLSSPHLADEHLNFLSGLSVLLQSEALRRSLRRAARAEEAIAALRRHAEI